jgi:epoxyqueuosine reductase
VEHRPRFCTFDEKMRPRGTSILAFPALLRQYRFMTRSERAARTVELARAAGFDLCGIAPSAEFPELARLEEWLERGHAGEMKYLRDERRRSPAKAMPEGRSVIVCALNYNTAFPPSTDAPRPEQSAEGPRAWISRYAWGGDYHDVLGEKLEALIANLRAEFHEPFETRAYVDTGPIVERVAAKHAGLGWLAKNTCLINEDLGSWLFLGVILTTLDLVEADDVAQTPAPDLCGNCRLCIDACPTEAIVEPYVLDARRCISYLTIELRGTIPLEIREQIGRHVFGCDICQDVCPWNRGSPATPLANFQPRQPNGHSLFSPELSWLLSMSEEEFREIFRRSPVKRTKWRGLVRNACVAIGNSGLRPGQPGYAKIAARLSELSASGDAILAEHAQWALARIGFAHETASGS